MQHPKRQQEKNAQQATALTNVGSKHQQHSILWQRAYDLAAPPPTSDRSLKYGQLTRALESATSTASVESASTPSDTSSLTRELDPGSATSLQQTTKQAGGHG